VATALAAGLSASANAADAHATQVARGRYLVDVGGCNDCHTPGYFFGKLDTSRRLGGSDVAFEVPGVGAFIGRNLTPDRQTGIGTWTKADIVKALQTGTTPSGRILAPIMPWRGFAHLSKSDAYAIATYLKSLKPVHHRIPGPFGPGEKVPDFMMRIVPPGQMVAAAPKKK
jgi:mono/diheme cytochrome c family protein